MSSMELSRQRWDEISAGFSAARVVVLGDVMLDHYVHGQVRRISPEAPVPVVELQRETFMPGGAGNVARNVAALGGAVDLIGVVGDDAAAGQLREALRETAVDTSGLVVEAGRPTTSKMRIAAHRQQVVRVDRETRRGLSDATRAAVLDTLRARIAGSQAVVIADYAKGVIDQVLFDGILEAADAADVPVLVDPKTPCNLVMKGCALLTPNRKETFELAGIEDPGFVGPDPASDDQLSSAISAVLARHHMDALLVTLSEAGLMLMESGKPAVHVPTMAREVADVSGAGDTVIASFALARVAGADLLEATHVANHAAGVVVGKSGTAQATIAEVRESLV